MVHDAGSKTLGSWPAVDNAIETWIGMLVGFPDVGATSAEAAAETGGEADGEVLADGRTLPVESVADGEATCGEAAAVGEATRGETAAAGVALRLPACLPTKNAPTQIPMTPMNPRIDSVRLLAGVIEVT
jgi:hypothetical protein